jgi:hypothetical protein
LLPKEVRQGAGVVNVRIEEGEYQGEIQYYDAKAEFVQGLRNILNDIGANPLIRRVLFGSSDFDFDRHMEVGGVLLVNTAKGELVDLARVLGKIVLMNLQNATFRRTPIISPFHHILVDEAPDYLYRPFKEFPAQARKYKVIITTLFQTIAQLADQFGEHYMTTLIGTMRHRMVYGDVPAYDAEYFSKMFGEKFTYQEGTNESSISPLQDNPQLRSGTSFARQREVSMTSGEIMFQDAFQCSVKIVVNNRPMPVQQIEANFVPAEEFEVAKITVDEEAGKIWLLGREQYRGKILGLVQEGIPASDEEEQEDQVIDLGKGKSVEKSESLFSLDPIELETSVSHKTKDQPGASVRFEAGNKSENDTLSSTKQSSTVVLEQEDREYSGEVILFPKLNDHSSSDYVEQPFEATDHGEPDDWEMMIKGDWKQEKENVEVLLDQNTNPFDQSHVSDKGNDLLNDLIKFVDEDPLSDKN